MTDHKKQALRLAGVASQKVVTATSQRAAAIKFASDSGASLREIAEATGLGHMTVKRILER